MQLSLDSYLLPAHGILGQRVKQEAVLLLPDKGEIKVLNEMGALIWSLADGSRTVREIAAIIATDYDVDLAHAQTDILAFVGELVQRHMLLLATRPAQPKKTMQS